MMDSLTRMAMAQRQLGLAAGEPPTSKGYPPSVYSMLPRLVERAGRTKAGSITAIYTVLVEGDDIDEPLADAVRGLLDGHIWLSRPLANRGQYPAIDILGSISRVADEVRDEGHHKAALTVRRVLATWRDIEDLVNIGAYVRGANADYDLAVQMRERVQGFLTQRRDERSSYDESVARLMELAQAIEQERGKLATARATG
jgi:flagellum-specific ATP synthase